MEEREPLKEQRDYQREVQKEAGGEEKWRRAEKREADKARRE
jgi:hypothetical protein